MRRALHSQRLAIELRNETRCAFLLDPQVRAFAETALNTLLKSGASSGGTPPPRDLDAETEEIFKTLLTLLDDTLVVRSETAPNQPSGTRHPLLTSSLRFQASLVADLVYQKRFHEKSRWNRCIGLYMKPWLGEEEATKFSERVRSHLHAVEQVGVLFLLDHCL